MNLPTEVFGDVVVVHTPDELGLDQAERFEQFITSLERSRVVLDLDNTELLDSAGLTALVSCHERLWQAGGGARVATTSATNRKILEITRLDQQIEVFDSVIDAVKSFAA
jgi:anti-sigma B factor antagonist